MRVLRLQMKTGFRKEIPAEYEFMKMYPPLHRDTAISKREVTARKIPYLYLYKGAVAKNPVYCLAFCIHYHPTSLLRTKETDIFSHMHLYTLPYVFEYVFMHVYMGGRRGRGECIRAPYFMQLSCILPAIQFS